MKYTYKELNEMTTKEVLDISTRLKEYIAEKLKEKHFLMSNVMYLQHKLDQYELEEFNAMSMKEIYDKSRGKK